MEPTRLDGPPGTPGEADRHSDGEAEGEEQAGDHDILPGHRPFSSHQAGYLPRFLTGGIGILAASA